MMQILCMILYKLKLRASKDILCEGRMSEDCVEVSSYAKKIEILTLIEGFFLDYMEKAPAQAVERIQFARLKNVLASAARIPYWQERIGTEDLTRIKSMGDLRGLPILTRADVRREFAAGRMHNETISPLRRIFSLTSGSTGQPLSFFLDTLLASGRRACYLRAIRWAANRRNPLIIKLKATQPFGLSRFPGFLPFKLQKGLDIDRSLADLCLFLRERVREAVLIDMYPSNLVRFTQLFKKMKLESSQIIGCVAGGEALLPGERVFINQTFSCGVVSRYASTEFEGVAQECGRHPQHAFHINAEYFYIEILDERGRPLPEGETGRIIITGLENEVMPFIRYDTGDRGSICAKLCPCGRTLPLLSVEGRTGEGLIVLPSGKTFTQFSILDVFYTPERVRSIRQFQVVRETPLEFIVYVVWDPTATPQEHNSLLQDLSSMFGEEVKVSVHAATTILRSRGGKRVGFVSKC